MRLFLLIVTFLLLSACSEEANQTQVVNPESAQRVSLKVSNMTCSTCGPTVRRALQQFSGVYKVIVDMKTRSATLYLDPDTTEIPTLIHATSNAGYPSEISL